MQNQKMQKKVQVIATLCDPFCIWACCWWSAAAAPNAAELDAAEMFAADAPVPGDAS